METHTAKVVTKVNLHQQTSDFAYWQTQSYQARLAALEEIRQEYHARGMVLNQNFREFIQSLSDPRTEYNEA